MRSSALLRQRSSLVNTEPMLLIRDDKCEIVIPDRILYEGVRPDHDICFPCTDLPECFPPLSRFERPCQKDRAHSKFLDALCQRDELLIVLAGEDLGRHHQCSLIPVMGCHDKRQKCKHGLSRTDVSLDQPGHDLSACKISLYFSEDSLLRPCKSVRQGIDQILRLPADLHRKIRRNIFFFALQHPERKNKKEEFVERDPLPCPEKIVPVRRKMDLLACFLLIHERIMPDDLLRKILI